MRQEFLRQIECNYKDELKRDRFFKSILFIKFYLIYMNVNYE